MGLDYRGLHRPGQGVPPPSASSGRADRARPVRLGTRRARSASSSGCSASTWVSSSLETLYQPGQQRLLSSTDARRDTWPGRTRIPRELVTGAGRRGSCSEVAVGATAMRDPED